MKDKAALKIEIQYYSLAIDSKSTYLPFSPNSVVL